MNDLVPLKVKIGLRSNGHADHPNFNALDVTVRGGVDWSHYIDRYADGWHYDKKCGHSETDLNNPDVPEGHIHRNDETGVQYGCILVPEAFAEAAVLKFPTVVTIIDEASFEIFFDDRAHAHEEEDLTDLDALKKIKARIDVESASGPSPKLAALEVLQAEAHDPSHPRLGIRKNHRRRWADFKKQRALTIRAKERKPV